MKIAVSFKRTLQITKEFEITDEQLNQLKHNPTIQFQLLPTDRPVISDKLDAYDENCNLLFSIGR